MKNSAGKYEKHSKEICQACSGHLGAWPAGSAGAGSLSLTPRKHSMQNFHKIAPDANLSWLYCKKSDSF